MKLMKSMSRLLLAGALSSVPIATALAAETTVYVGRISPVAGAQTTPLDQAMAAAADVRSADAAQAKADKYEKRAKMFKFLGGGPAYKSGELQRADAAAAKYSSRAAEYRERAGQTLYEGP